VLKIKRAVRYPYLDFSTLPLRRAGVERELAANRHFAPDLYIGVTPITREADGNLAVGGSGTPVEWALVMRRFPDGALLSEIVRRGPLGAPLVKALAGAVLEAHRTAAPVRTRDEPAELRRIVDDVIAGLDLCATEVGEPHPDLIGALRRAAHAVLGRTTVLAARRAIEGHVRRCHGDLHLGNVALVDGHPMLFDALEFDERLATTDTLYDLAFLVMDLDAAGHRGEANLLLALYLWLGSDDSDLDALALLPLFLALRALVRAMVGLQRRAAMSVKATTAGSRASPTPEGYLGDAVAWLAPPPPRLIAVGGLSGTGKSTVASALAPEVGAAPGALHLRSDLERKRLLGVGETDRLRPEAYTPGAGAAVYARLLDRARRALSAGHSVIVDAVFATEPNRDAAEALARNVGVAFTGVWLTAPAEVAGARIEARKGDASDATPTVAAAQRDAGVGQVTWRSVDTSAGLPATLEAVRSLVGAKSPP
jgi:aminoglycoside phosphotransferase family enzyme/predicted kinase